MKFSVAMSVYKNDNAIYFDRALESVTIKQTIKPDEIILVVDGPVSKEIDDVIEKYSKVALCFNVIRLKENKGLGNALKLAVESASNPYIARMDSDDVSVPTRFEEQLRFFERFPNCDVVGGDITEFVDDESNIVGKRAVPLTDEQVHNYMRTRCAMNHVTVMYKKTSVLSAGNYQDWYCNEDYYLWIRMWMKGFVFRNTGSVLVNVRVGKEMYQRRGGKRYYESERDLQKYMLEHGMIDEKTYLINVGKRFIVQRLLPNKIRGFVFQTFARTK